MSRGTWAADSTSQIFRRSVPACSAVPARQRRQVEGESIDALDLRELRLHQRLQLDRGALALVPRFQEHAGDAVLRAVDAVERKAQVGFRKTGKYLVELFAVKIQVVDIGVFGRLQHREHDALVFFRGDRK